MEFSTIWPILLLSLVHLFGSKFRFLLGVPRSIWLSGAGGVSVAFVFMHLFPELHEGQQHLVRSDLWSNGEQHHVYMISLIGLSVFYGLERAVVHGKRKEQKDEKWDDDPPGIFWLHIASFSLYNAFIGHLVFRQEQDADGTIVLFTVAMALHFLVNDLSLLNHHENDYRKYGRWCLVLALVVGWMLGLVLDISQTSVALFTAFIAGGIILNVLKEELPEERESRYWAFLLGAGAYSLVLLVQ